MRFFLKFIHRKGTLLKYTRERAVFVCTQKKYRNPMKTPQFGLRSTVYLFDTVVDQSVLWSRHRDWSDVELNVPTKSGQSVAQTRWHGDVLQVRDRDAGIVELQTDNDHWSWEGPEGVRVRFDRIQMKKARRGSGEAWGDVALLVMMLALMVGIGQLNALFRMVVGERVESTAALEPSPELIARYLRQEFGGEETGVVAHKQRQSEAKTRPLVFLPSGSSGPMDRTGGGAKAGPSPKRSAPVEAAEESQTQPNTPAQALAEKVLANFRHTQDEPDRDKPKPRLPKESIERFVGWGFHDWLDVAESSPSVDQEMRDRLSLAREIMRIDPDDPFALLTVSYYAYLSEHHTLCRDLYQRYIELYPEDAAGWNNLALSYKRTGEYGKEEDLYRIALALEPGNSNTKNNLAVNLAHQGRYTEARSLMTQLSLAPEELPYAELHRAKIAASAGKERKAYRHLRNALSLTDRMDTFHHIEFRQDIRLDPSFAKLRKQTRFRDLLVDTYGEESPLAISQTVRVGERNIDG